jgi:hypothetical protein
MIEVPAEKTIEEWSIEITENIPQNFIMAEPVKITYLSISSD